MAGLSKRVWLLLILLLSGVGAQAQTYTNVVLIVADDLGYGDLGSYGSADALTPHIDRLSQTGLRLTNFYVQPVCTPTRYSLLTSQYVNRSQDLLFSVVRPAFTTIGMRETDGETIAKRFQAAGYRTAMVGKWHLGTGDILCCDRRDSPFHPLRHGFDSFYGLFSGAIDYNTHEVEGLLDWYQNRTKSYDAGYATELLTSEAVAFIEKNRTRPFFLYLPYTAPHAGRSEEADPVSRMQLPLGREREFLSRFDHLYPGDDDIRKRYLSMLAVMDDGIGRILDVLDRRKLTDKTLVIFLSDNGGQHDSGGSNAPLRGEKGTFWEGGIRVPAILRLPGRLPASTASDQVMHAIDVMPTALGLAGLPPATVDGVDLSHDLRDRTTSDRDIFYHDPIWGDVFRRGAWKYLRSSSDGVDMLFNVAADPGETQDLASSQPAMLAELKEAHLKLARMLPLVPPTIRIYDPYFASAWTSGQAHNVRWVSLNLTEDSPVRILVRRRYTNPSTGKKVWTPYTTLASETRNDGTWRWFIPAAFEPSTEYQLVIRSVVDPTITSTSTFFAIATSENVVPTTATSGSDSIEPTDLRSFPNPFSQHATIEYVVPNASHVQMRVYDMMGRQVQSLLDEHVSAGRHHVLLDGDGLPGGTYFIRLRAAGNPTHAIAVILSR